MQKLVSRATQALACLALLVTMSVTAQAADANGTWTWTTPGRNGGPERTSTLKLKTEGDKVTGTINGRQGQEDIKITDGKITGEEITFKVSRTGQNGNTFTQKYTGKLSGDTIKGKVTFDRNGEEQSRDWEAKRKTDDKK